MGAKIIGYLIGWLKSLQGSRFDKVKAILSKTFSIPLGLDRETFISSVSAHLGRHPMAYATLLSALSVFGPDIFGFISASGASEDELKYLKTVLGSFADDTIPQYAYVGGDGSVETVGGVSTEEFQASVNMVQAAKNNIQEISSILGISPKSVIELSVRFAAVEPQHALLFK